MDALHPHIVKLQRCIDLEEQEQVARFRLDKEHTLRSLKAEGLALHPIIVTRKGFGYADYPELNFRLHFPQETSQFRDGSAIECFFEGEEAIKGVLLNLSGTSGELRLFAPDFPDWIEEKGVGIKLAPDHRTTQIMKKALRDLPSNKVLYPLFEKIHGNPPAQGIDTLPPDNDPPLLNQQLNPSQNRAVKAIMDNEALCIVHGPPGTGKTTTLVAAVKGLVEKGEKVLVSAPSNTAVDHFALGLHQAGIRILRVGNASKANEAIFPFTPEGKLANDKIRKEIKDLKIRAEEFRKMALKYKRSFGQSEREQRNLLFREVKQIREEIRKRMTYHEARLYEEAQVILGTPIALYDTNLNGLSFQTLVIDEAGQCLEPLAWCIFPLAEKWVLAGDHLQLPPTVLSDKAQFAGFNRSILETCFGKTPSIYLLDTQYRMREAIAGFSSAYFYNHSLKSAAHLDNRGVHITFYDTAGAGFDEEKGSDGQSLQNPGELQSALKILETFPGDTGHWAFISPYAGQVSLSHDVLPPAVRKSTIDSFQGQEMENVMISLVRSNEDGQIGFLKDYRRMNVAMTRAKENLVVIGDSATIGRDPFFSAFLEYVEQAGHYKTVWELE